MIRLIDIICQERKVKALFTASTSHRKYIYKLVYGLHAKLKSGLAYGGSLRILERTTMLVHNIR